MKRKKRRKKTWQTRLKQRNKEKKDVEANAGKLKKTKFKEIKANDLEG